MKTTVLRGALLGAFVAVAGAANAVTYQVGPSRTPYTQLTQVANLLNPGDVVELDGNATYNRVTMTRSGTQAQPITIRGMAQGAQRPVINGASAGTNGTALQLDANHYVIEDVVAANASTRCVYMHGHNLTLRRVQVHTCAKHGILGSDEDSGDMLLTEVEVFNQGVTPPNQFDHPIYIATDQALYPNAVLRIEKSWIHDNNSGNSIKSRAKTLKAFYNWIETTNGQNHTIEAIGPDGTTPCPVPNGTNDADLCTAEIVGNVLISRSNNANMMRLGSDGTGWSNGRYHVVNNTFVANDTFNSQSAAMIRAFGPIQSIELHNNIFWLQLGDTVAIRIVRDKDASDVPEAQWVSGRRVTGTKNIVTGSASAYASGVPAQQIQGLTGTIFTTTGAVFVNSNLASPTTLDLRLQATSPARLVGNAGNTSTAGYQIPNPTNLPVMQPPLMRPSPGTFSATARPQATDGNGNPVGNAIAIGALEYSTRASLVNHYYQSILRRAPDAGGKTFWEGEADRVSGLGANINETWFSMAQQFYFSAEYLAFNRNNNDFVTDLYTTFFNRSPDSGGLNFWLNNLASGMPREVALAEFMFSTEFRNFTQALFGNTAARAEVDAVIDFYRGLLSRLPDNGGFTFWRDRFRAAQCQSPAAVTSEVEAISSAFALSAEYTGRNRTNAQYVGDLYNAFLRRGGDLGGVQFWIGQVNSGAQTREQVRVQFRNSPEFQARVNAIIQQGCL